MHFSSEIFLEVIHFLFVLMFLIFLLSYQPVKYAYEICSKYEEYYLFFTFPLLL